MIKFPTTPFSISIISFVVLLMSATHAQAEELTLAVANSTCKAIKKIGDLYQQTHSDIALTYICKSSGRLAKGLRGNAIEADIYVSANRDWMDYMIDADLVSPTQVAQPWGNELVVATPLNSKITDFKWEDLDSDKVETILIGDPSTAPFGRYGKQALATTELWKKVRHKIQTKKHITLLVNTLAEAPPTTVGILFPSNINESVRMLHTIDPTWHAPIRYYLAPLTKEHPKNNVASFLRFIQGDEGQAVFLDQGFKLTKH